MIATVPSAAILSDPLPGALAVACKPAVRQMLLDTEPLTTTLVWHEAETDKPDADESVLCQLVDDDEPGWLGYWDGSCWCSVDGSEFAGTVVRWARVEWPAP